MRWYRRIIPYVLDFSIIDATQRKPVALGKYKLPILWQEREFYISHPEKFLSNVLMDLRAFVERGLYGWSRLDAYSLDMYLASWLGDALDYLLRVDPGISTRYINKARALLHLPDITGTGDIPDEVMELADKLKAADYSTVSAAFKHYSRRFDPTLTLQEERTAHENMCERMKLFAEIFTELWI